MPDMSDQRAALGALVPDWRPPPRPDGATLAGRFAQLHRLDAEAHSKALFDVIAGADHIWAYMPYGPFATHADYSAWMQSTVSDDGHLFYAIKNLETGRFEGVASYLRINPESGSIEVGHIHFSPALQRTRSATEAMYLMMQWAFEAGYRRYEWKCNALNMASRRAAQRLGFSYEGVFRQATVAKGRNRDTAWFAAIDQEWPQLDLAFTRWLSSENFDAGVQRQALSALTQPIRVASDPMLPGGG